MLTIAGALGMWHAPRDAAAMPDKRPAAHAFRLSHALLFVAIVAAMLALSAFLSMRFGSSSVLAASMFVALAETHAAAASVVAKSVVAFSTGGPRYGLRVTAGLLTMLAAAAGVAWWWPPGPVGGAA